MLEIKHRDRTLQTMVPEDMKRWSVRPCTFCKGTGLCPQCKDPQKRTFLRGRRHRKAEEGCHACHGNKNCRACAGTGRIGTGRIGGGASKPDKASPISSRPELSRNERVALILDLLSGRTSLPACRDRGLPIASVARWLSDFLEAGSHAVTTETGKTTGPALSDEETVHELRKRLAPIIGHPD